MTTSRNSSARCRRLERVAIRHTVGLDDAIEGKGGVADPAENSGARYFKLKLNGDPEHDAARLIRIGKELATLPHDYSVTLDANEQYADLAGLGALVDRLDRDGALAPIAAKLLYIEQPMPRDIFGQSPLGALARRDFIIDEADDSYDAFPAARALGYRGISVEILQGYLQVDGQCDPRRHVEHGGRTIFFIGRGPDLPGRPRRAAGSRARRADRRHPCRAQRPSLCRRFCRYAGRRGAGIPVRASRSLRPTTETASGCRSTTAISSTGSLTAPGFASGVHPMWSALSPLDTTKSKNPAGAKHMTTQRLGVIMNGVTGRMGLNQHLIRSIVAIRDARRRAAVQRRPRDAGSDPGRPRRRQGRGARQALQRRALDHRPRQGAGRERTTPSSSMPRPRRRGRRC